MANGAKVQCPTMVNFNRRCIRAEGHAGACGGGLKSPRVGVYECGFCRGTFPSLEEFDSHAPCSAVKQSTPTIDPRLKYRKSQSGRLEQLA